MLRPTTVRGCITLALEVERAGALFYARLATRFENLPALRELFLSLAEDERAHEDEFARLLLQTPGEAVLQQVSGTDLRVLAVHEFFAGPRAALANLDKARSVHEALRTVLEFERQTLASFLALRENLEAQPGLDVIERVIGIERIHVERLEALVD